MLFNDCDNFSRIGVGRVQLAQGSKGYAIHPHV